MQLFNKLKEKIGWSKPTQAPLTQIPAELLEQAGKDGAPDLKELQKKGLLGKFFRHWKNPAFLSQIRAMTARMQADGVDLKDAKAVKAWIEAHAKELESGGVAAPAAQKPATFVHAAAAAGRNDPCPCGSGKKHKKCCQAKA